MFPGTERVSLRDIDHAARTIMIVEAAPEAGVPWTKPEDFNFDPDDPLRGLLGRYPGGFPACFVDGSVQFIHERIDREALNDMFMRGGKTGNDD